MNEHLPRHTKSAPSASNRSFGVVFTFFFAIIGLLPILSAHPVRLWALVLAAIFLILALLAPSSLTLLNQWWTKFGALLHQIVSPIALGVLFFVAVTPIALLMRLMGKDPLSTRLDTEAQSYWIKRDPPGPSPDSLKNQF